MTLTMPAWLLALICYVAVGAVPLLIALMRIAREQDEGQERELEDLERRRGRWA